jgi:hypothetical protein
LVSFIPQNVAGWAVALVGTDAACAVPAAYVTAAVKSIDTQVAAITDDTIRGAFADEQAGVEDILEQYAASKRCVTCYCYS